ncbi:MAG: 2-phospho-L-lactate guanylyltransferase [Methanosarcinales archaeon]|nr:2-phospho-L-lactate guanylyltransferase [Methanosarcinales archaeon]
MRIVVPFKKENAKSRLAGVLTPDERGSFAMCMLRDVIDVADGFDLDILTPSLLTDDCIDDIHRHVLLSDLGLNEALNEYLLKQAECNCGHVMIVMADLPLIRKYHLAEIACSDSDVVIAPGKGGGTNILCIRDPSRFRVDYYGTSFLDHLQIAHENDLTVAVYDSFAASTDIDEPEDLVELLLHGHGGSARNMLVDLGFVVAVRNGRSGVERSGDRVVSHKP